MKRRLLSLLLAVLLLVCSAPWAAAVEKVTFSPVQTYHNHFSDVKKGTWYYESIKTLYELGLTTGKSSSKLFAPSDELTVAEAITMAARLRSLYETKDSEAGPNAHRRIGGPWYSPYVAYLQARSVIGKEFEGAYQKPATRAQMAHILARALPASHFTAINADAVTVGYASRKFIQDVTEYTPYQQDILALYQWGILNGVDAAGSFLPAEHIQRSQVAAMVARLAYSNLRLTLHWDPSLTNSAAGIRFEDLIHSNDTFHTAPAVNDQQAIDDNIRYMLSRGERRMVLSYGRNKLTSDMANDLLSAFLHGVRQYLEQGYNRATCSYSPTSGSVVLTFSSSLYDDRMIDSYRTASLEAAITIHDMLWADGTITASMSDYTKARTYFTWLCNHCEYDYSGTDTSISHSGYGALVNGLATCDGYTAAYNLLLKLEGIQCGTVSLGDHLWSMAELDGKTYHIDPTWGDQSSTISYRYFGMTEAYSFSRFA